jgi:tape measure domain-containing protein
MAAPELRLSVGLDLEFFRGQMRKAVNIAQSEFTARLNVRVNRQVLDSELNTVSRMFARRDFRINVNDTAIKTARLNAQKLKNTLDLIGRTKYKINLEQAGGAAGGFQQSPQGAAGLLDYMRSQGLSGGGFVGAGRSARLEKALNDLTVKQLQSLAKQEGITGVSKLRKDPLIQKLLSDLSQQAMEGILGNAKLMLQSPFPYVATTGVSGRTLGARVSGQMPMGSPLPMLPAAGQTAAFAMGTMPSNLRQPSMPSSGMMAPSSAISQTALAGGQFASTLRNADQYLNRAKVPLSGAIQELGSEFGNAVKQVLLFGTAYKGLAFLLDIPNQAFDASKALQTFNNQLVAVTGGAQQANRALGFVNELTQKFNVPLQSARDGFIKLYASMAPAGFNTEQINGLFEGIAKAAATFGLSSDKVDRVNYAFAQMASKGQIMSEELKGQLGDVLPGALGLFAEAAQMTIPEFSKAMEDGAFTGKAMEQVLDNVSVLLNTKFANAAKGAAGTLQGQLNGMQNAMQSMYEAFEPVVNSIASSLFPLITSTVKDASSAVQAFSASISGNAGPANMLTANAGIIYNIFTQLHEIFKAVGTILSNLAPTFLILGQAVLTAFEQLAKFINTPIGQFLANAVMQTALLNAAFQLLAKAGILQAVAALIQFVTNTKGAISSLQLLIATSATARLALISLGAGLVIAALSALSSKLSEVHARMQDIQTGAQAAGQAIAAMSQTEAVLAARKYEGQIALLRRFQKEAKGLGGVVGASAEEINAMAAAGGTPGASFTAPLVDKERGLYGPGFIDPSLVEGAIQRLSQLESSARYQARPIPQTTPSLPQIDLSNPEDAAKNANKEAAELNRLVQENLRLNMELGIIGKDELSQLQAKIDLAGQILTLQLKEIDLTKQGAARDQAERNAILEYKKIVALAKQEWTDTTGKIDDIKLKAEELADKIAGKNLPDKTPFQQAVIDINKEIIDTIQAADALSKQLQALGGKRPEYKQLADSLQSIKLAATTMTPGQIATAARQRESEPLRKQLKEQLNQMQQAGLPPSTLRETQGQLSAAGIEPTSTVGKELLELARQVDLARPFAEMAEAVGRVRNELTKLTDIKTQIVTMGDAIGSSFGNAFKGMVNGSMTAQQALGSFFQSVADSFLDMAAQMIAKWIQMQIIGLAQSLLPGLGGLGGIGKATGGFAGMTVANNAVGEAMTLQMMGFASGGIAAGGFRAFANGGIVAGPTLGLVGEGRFNEAIVPLPNGKSIPVDLGDGAGSNISTNIVINVSNGQAQSSMTGGGASDLGRKMEGAVKQVIVNELRPGGVLAGVRR